MGLLGFFLGKNKNMNAKVSQALDLYTPYFSGKYDPELNNTYVSICETYARHLSKLTFKVYLKDEESKNKAYMNDILNLRMNPTMSATQGWEILAKDYFMTNTAIAFIEWDITNIKQPLKAIWPLDPDKHSLTVAKGSDGMIYVRFYLDGAERTVDLDDLIVITRNAKPSTLFGQGSKAVDTVLKVMQTNYEGIEEAIKTSAFIRFLVQSTTLMKDDVKKKKAQAFADAYLSKNSASVAYIDQAEKVIPINSKATYANEKEMNFFKEEIYRYFGANDKILTSTYSENEWQSFYEGVLEPFVMKLVNELNYKLLTKKERATGNKIILDANRLQTASLSTRIKIAQTMMRLPLVKPNDIASLLYLPKMENGDTEYEFLNYQNTNKSSKKKEDSESEEDESND